MDISGQKFNKLTVVKFSHIQNHQSMWLCSCDCGGTTIVSKPNLKNGSVKGCGCGYIKHGCSIGGEKSPEYNVWLNMKSRCLYKKHPRYKDWGGRGIKVCDRWLDSFENFISDMGKRPSKNHSIERIDNNGNYEPNNCKWATRKEQINNRGYSRFVEFNGNKICLSDFSRKIGADYDAVRHRLNKYKESGEQLFSFFNTKMKPQLYQ